VTPLGFRLQTPRDDASIALVGAQRAVAIAIVVAARTSVALTATITVTLGTLSTLVVCVGLPTERELARSRAHCFDGERAIVQRLPLGDAACVWIGSDTHNGTTGRER
jgi:hypothetical protein